MSLRLIYHLPVALTIALLQARLGVLDLKLLGEVRSTHIDNGYEYRVEQTLILKIVTVDGLARKIAMSRSEWQLRALKLLEKAIE